MTLKVATVGDFDVYSIFIRDAKICEQGKLGVKLYEPKEQMYDFPGKVTAVLRTQQGSFGDRVGIKAGDVLCVPYDGSWRLIELDEATNIARQRPCTLYLLRAHMGVAQPRLGVPPPSMATQPTSASKKKDTKTGSQKKKAASAKKEEEKDSSDEESVSEKWTWDDRYQQLKQLYEETGSLKIPKDKKKSLRGLANWMTRQRKISTKLTDTQRALLDGLGFDWKPKGERNSQAWDENFEKIVAYKKEHGTFQHPDLFAWLANQRSLYNREMIREDRRKKMDAAGFGEYARDYGKPESEVKKARKLESDSERPSKRAKTEEEGADAGSKGRCCIL